MNIDENDRLDLRRALEDLFGDQRLAAIAMKAMPPLDDDRLATGDDLLRLAAELRGEMAELRGEMAELRGEMAEQRGGMATEFAAVRAEAANNLRLVLAGQVVTMALLGGWVAAVT